MADGPPHFYTDRTLGDRWLCDPRTIRRLRQRGQLPYVRLPSGAIRIPADAVDAVEADGLVGELPGWGDDAA